MTSKPVENGMTGEERIKAAIDLAVSYGGIDGAHHKDWVIDQMVRVLAGDQYDKIVYEACLPWDEQDQCFSYEWSIGVPP